MKTAVLVPSHIYYPDQLQRLDTCLKSLSSQTYIPDIFVSISFANDTYKREFATLLRKYPTINFKLSPEQKFQMEHLSILSPLVINYDLLMFCDDDDTYHPLRVEAFETTFEQLRKHCEVEGKRFGGVREILNNDKFASEFWANGICPWLLTEFFERVKGYEDLLRHKFADMYLREFLTKMGGDSLTFALVPPDVTCTRFYNYTMDNPNSICARHITQEQSSENGNQIIQDNITVALICRRVDLVKQYMNDASAPLSRLREVVPEVKRILALTKILYL